MPLTLVAVLIVCADFELSVLEADLLEALSVAIVANELVVVAITQGTGAIVQRAGNLGRVQLVASVANADEDAAI